MLPYSYVIKWDTYMLVRNYEVTIILKRDLGGEKNSSNKKLTPKINYRSGLVDILFRYFRKSTNKHQPS